MNPILPPVVVLTELSSDEEDSIAPSAVEPTRQVFDQDGDLYLHVHADTEEPHMEFKVCSRSLRRSSRVWKKMLFGGWLEEKPASGEWVVPLTSDQPLAISALLAIIHSKFELLPEPMTIDLLYDIIVTSEKYEMMSVLRPFARRWLDTASQPCLTGHNFDINLMKLTHVMWEFGCEKGLTSVVERLVFDASSSELEGLSDVSKELQSQGRPQCGPPDLVENAAQARLVIIQVLLDFWAKQMARRTDSGHGPCCVAHPMPDPTDRAMCDSRVLAAVTRHMMSPGWSRVPMPENASDVGESIHNLVADMGMLHQHLEPLDGHPSCGPSSAFIKLKESVLPDPLTNAWRDCGRGTDSRGRRWKDALSPQHRKRLAAQRETTGLDFDGKTTLG